ncbi:hypothetical protein [Streptacidiphilus sp. EB103A]|uniref:hypothetical protein n=1 Tax=Streptacidiphilus sp. EB103A TaxID=3156275 RepID=UPI003515DE0B
MNDPTPEEEDLLRRGLHDMAATEAGPVTAPVGALVQGGRRARRVRRAVLVGSVAVLVGCGSVAGVNATTGTTSTVAQPAVSSSSSAAASTTPLPARTVDPAHQQLGPAHPVVGRTYPYDLLVHCEIRYAVFGGRSWQTDHTIDAPTPTPDPRTGITAVTGMLPGYMTLVSDTEARFQGPGLASPVVFRVMDHDAPLCA